MDDFYPRYIKTYRSGELARRIDQAYSLLTSCSLCPRLCKVNRVRDERGYCQTGLRAKVCSSLPHHGEEPPLSGRKGSGTIFFSNCTMSCVYCQNYKFSQLHEGQELGPEELSELMLELQRIGCHNINLVTPTHVLPQILKALLISIEQGLRIPLVYNTSGYELPDTIRLLDGVVDIYLPDMRYADEEYAVAYSGAPGYPHYNQKSVKLMHEQVGTAVCDEQGIMIRGLIVRHLVLPCALSGTAKIMRFLAREVSVETSISLMSQYLPCYRASEFKELSRRITMAEYTEAQESMERYGLYNGWVQEAQGLERFAGIHIKPSLPK